MRQMMSHSFDTHKYIKALVAKGIKEPQAEVIITSIADSRDFDLSRLATKEQLAKVQNDLDMLRKEIEFVKKEIEMLRKEVKADIATVKFDILKWLIPFLVAIIIAIFVK